VIPDLVDHPNNFSGNLANLLHPLVDLREDGSTGLDFGQSSTAAEKLLIHISDYQIVYAIAR
jgi:hypothetical protein